MATTRRPYAGAKVLETPRRQRLGEVSEAGSRGAESDRRMPLSPSGGELHEAYEVGYFARKHRLDRAKAIDILMRAGDSRERADELAARMVRAAGG